MLTIKVLGKLSIDYILFFFFRENKRLCISCDSHHISNFILSDNNNSKMKMSVAVATSVLSVNYLKSALFPRKTHLLHEKMFLWNTFCTSGNCPYSYSNSESPDQPARTCRLILAFAVW